MQIVPAGGGSARVLADHTGCAAQHRGLVGRWPPGHRHRGGGAARPRHGAARRWRAGRRARWRPVGERGGAQQHRHVAGVRGPGFRQRAGAVRDAPRRHDRAAEGRHRAAVVQRAARPQRGSHLEIAGRASGRGHPHVSGRLPRRHQGAAAARDPRRTGRRLRPQLHRGAQPLSRRGVRRARLRGAARQPARQQRLRQGVPLRQPIRLGRRRLSRPDERRRSRDRDGRRRSRPAGRDGLELRRLHDVVGRHADEALQGGVGRRRGDEPHELHRRRRHPGLRARLLRRRILGHVRGLARRTRRCSTSRA